MIKEGCLEGVDEVYGYHNIPNFPEGDIRVVEGAMMASATTVKIKVLGKGGHGSMPHMIKDVISAGAAIFTNLHTVKSRCIDSRDNFTFTMTHFTSGTTHNVFPDEAFMQGSIRSYSRPVLELIKTKIHHIATSTAEAFDCKAEVDIVDLYPPTVNHKEQTQHVIRVANKYVGGEHVKSDDLPVAGSEDFSYYLENRPGCFFMLGTRVAGNDYFCHTSRYDYNDSMIPTGALMFVGIVEDRLAAKII